MSINGKIVRLIVRPFLRDGVVTDVEDLGDFRLVSLAGEMQIPAPGSKIQLLFESNAMRTYTPIATDNGVRLLGYKNAGGPGAQWIADVQSGTLVQFAGPQRILTLPDGPVILVGDETSIAVAASYHDARPGQVHAIIQGGSATQIRAAATRVGLRNEQIVCPQYDDEKTLDAIMAARADWPTATIALTGGARMIIALRNALRALGVGNFKVKTHWVHGRCGIG